MINLLNNAIKFTNQGEVFVKYVVEEEGIESPYPQVPLPAVWRESKQNKTKEKKFFN